MNSTGSFPNGSDMHDAYRFHRANYGHVRAALNYNGLSAGRNITFERFSRLFSHFEAEGVQAGQEGSVRPTYADMYANYPKDAYGNDMPGPDVYKLVGGQVERMYNSNPSAYQNACALRVSRALNYSGVNIPDVAGTFTGADGKNYFLSSHKLYNWMNSYYGTPDITSVSKLSGNQGIYIMQVNRPADFGAMGHATLYNGSDCIGGHCYFNAASGIYNVGLWILP